MKPQCRRNLTVVRSTGAPPEHREAAGGDSNQDIGKKSLLASLKSGQTFPKPTAAGGGQITPGHPIAPA